MRNADLALYRAKGDGRGTYRFFEPDMDAQMQERRAMEYDLRKALAGGEFELHYQPVVNLETNKISGFEALIRWRHPEKGMISPGTFIPLAEEIGFIVPLGEWVIRQACATAAKWPAHVKIAVNLSPVQFRESGLGAGRGQRAGCFRSAAERLELEITETALLQDSEATLAMLYQLRELGVRIAMDDFGTGYSIAQLPAELPLRSHQDRSLVHQGHRRRRRLAQHRAGRGGAGQGARHGDDGGGRGNQRAARDGQVGGLHRDAGLPVQPAAAAHELEELLFQSNNAASAA